MFQNPLNQRLYVSTVMFVPLIIVFIMVAVYFGLEVLEIISTEVYEGRHGNISFLHEDPWGYWGGVFKYSSFSVASVCLLLTIRRKKHEE